MKALTINMKSQKCGKLYLKFILWRPIFRVFPIFYFTLHEDSNKTKTRIKSTKCAKLYPKFIFYESNF